MSLTPSTGALLQRAILADKVGKSVIYSLETVAVESPSYTHVDGWLQESLLLITTSH